MSGKPLVTEGSYDDGHVTDVARKHVASVRAAVA
jgi:hypothetical protein